MAVLIELTFGLLVSDIHVNISQGNGAIRLFIYIPKGTNTNGVRSRMKVRDGVRVSYLEDIVGVLQQ